MKGVIITLCAIGLIVLVIGGMFVSISNNEVDLRTAIEQKQKDNSSEFDNMWKKINQVAQVTDAQRKALLEIFTGYAQARTTDGGGLMKWITESVPHVDTSTFNQLMNTITGSRDAWTFRQKELLDLKREHDRLLRRFPSNMILSFLGRKPIEVIIITSGKTEQAFVSGKDDDTKVFSSVSNTNTVPVEKP